MLRFHVYPNNVSIDEIYGKNHIKLEWYYETSNENFLYELD